MAERLRALGDRWGQNFSSKTSYLCDLGHIIQPLCIPVSLSVKWRWENACLMRYLWELMRNSMERTWHRLGRETVIKKCQLIYYVYSCSRHSLSHHTKPFPGSPTHCLPALFHIRSLYPNALFLWGHVLKSFPPVLVSCGCYNKLALTRWLKTTEIYSVTALVDRSLKSKGQQGFSPSGACQGPSSSFCGCPHFFGLCPYQSLLL